MTSLRDLLEEAYNGLKWYRDMHPEDDSGADDELYARIDAALAAPHPSQGAFTKEELEVLASAVGALNFTKYRYLFDKVEALRLAAPHPPVSAEAGKGVEGWKWMTHPDWNNGQPIPARIFTEEGVTYYQPFDMDGTDFEWEIRDEQWQEVSPSESVAVSVEVSEDAILEAAEKVGLAKVLNPIGMQTGKVAAIGSTYMTEEIIDFAKAVLALAGSAKQSAALERMARLDDEMGDQP